MSARVFVDTNVLVYARDRTDEEKNRVGLAWPSEDVASLVTWRPESIGLSTIDAAWGLEDRFQLSWWDALIAAAARAAECTHLLSEDL